MNNNPFQIILTNQEFKKKLVNGFKIIFTSIYKDIPNRWMSKQMFRNGNSFSIYGPADLDSSTNKYEWSKINLVNTNYSALEKIRNFLYYEGVKIIFPKNPLKDINKTSSSLDLFLIELEKRKYEYFYDGVIKDQIISIINGTWGRGSDHSTQLKNKYKKYFTDAIGIDDKGDETGDVEDMLLGIDNTIFFENNIKKTTQNKGCYKVEKVDDNYHVYCTVDYSKYNDSIVNYFVFFPSYEPEKIYIFKNDKNLVKNDVINEKPVFILNESLLYYDGEK